MANFELGEAIEDCVSARTCSNSPFNDWESDFIISVEEQFEKQGSLSAKQLRILEKIWNKI